MYLPWEEWIQMFQANPTVSIYDAIWHNSLATGTHAQMDSEVFLLHWLHNSGPQSTFVRCFDAELAQLIESKWGQLAPEDPFETSQLTRFWIKVCQLIRCAEPCDLVQSKVALSKRITGASKYLQHFPWGESWGAMQAYIYALELAVKYQIAYRPGFNEFGTSIDQMRQEAKDDDIYVADEELVEAPWIVIARCRKLKFEWLARRFVSKADATRYMTGYLLA